MLYAYEFLDTVDGKTSRRGPRALADTTRDGAAASARARYKAVCALARSASEPAPPAVRVLENGHEIFRWRLAD